MEPARTCCSPSPAPAASGLPQTRPYGAPDLFGVNMRALTTFVLTILVLAALPVVAQEDDIYLEITQPGTYSITATDAIAHVNNR